MSERKTSINSGPLPVPYIDDGGNVYVDNTPEVDQVPVWNGTSWSAQDQSGGGGGGGGGTTMFVVYSTNFEDVRVEQDPGATNGRYATSHDSTGVDPVVTSSGLLVPNGGIDYGFLVCDQRIPAAVRALDLDLIFTARITGYDPTDAFSAFVGIGGATTTAGSFGAASMGVYLTPDGAVSLVSGTDVVVLTGVSAAAFHTYRLHKTSAGVTAFVDGVSKGSSSTVPATTSAGIVVNSVVVGAVDNAAAGPEVLNLTLHAAV